MAEIPEEALPPGFRFHPTDEELILHYLRNQATSLPCPVSIIAEVDIYKFDPWDLPAKAAFGDREWYFFSPRDRKYPNGVRPNRAAASGYWKATGTDKRIVAAGPRGESIGVKKALVFYQGRPPKGLKTDWIMHEYRLSGSPPAAADERHRRPRDSSMRLDDWVLCRIYKKSSAQQSSSMDRDGDDGSVSEEAEASFLRQGGAAKMLKTSSLTDLLDADFSILSRLLHEDPSETAGIELPNQHSLLGFGGDGASVPPSGVPLPKSAAAESTPAAGGAGGGRKRRRAAGYGEAAAGGGGASASHCNMADQLPTFLHRQTLLSSRFGLRP